MCLLAARGKKLVNESSHEAGDGHLGSSLVGVVCNLCWSASPNTSSNMNMIE